jgi:hypothetical protein
MATPDTLRYTKFPFANGSGAIPDLGLGTLITDPRPGLVGNVGDKLVQPFATMSWQA